VVHYEHVPDNVRGSDGVAQVAVVERAYLNTNGVGPWYSAILPCQVFLVPFISQPPAGVDTSTYPFVM
jgi:hypothetical protein